MRCGAAARHRHSEYGAGDPGFEQVPGQQFGAGRRASWSDPDSDDSGTEQQQVAAIQADAALLIGRPDADEPWMAPIDDREQVGLPTPRSWQRTDDDLVAHPGA